MKKTTPFKVKLFGVLVCIAPVALVSAASRADYWELDAIEVSKPKQIVLAAKDSENPVDVSEIKNDAGKIISALDVGRSAGQDIDLAEVDWVITFTSRAKPVDQSIDCRIPEHLTEKFSNLSERIVSQEGETALIQFELGKVLRKARGPDCHALAFNYFLASAESGYGGAYAKLANAYRKGLGVERDFRKALENYERSARRGFISSIYRLIEMTERGGSGYSGNPAKASAFLDEFLPLLESRIRGGDAIAARSLGRLYNNSNLVQLDPAKAIRFMEYAAGLGDAIAMHDLVLLLIEHRRIGLKRADIFPLLLESSRLGYSAAFTAIGRLHLKGEFGFPRSEAPRWFRSGVDAGHPGAMKELAELYFKGDLVAQDTSLAQELATQGARLNHRGSKRLLDDILESENSDSGEG